MSSLPTVKYLPYTSLITAAEAIIQNKEFVSFLHNKKSILTSNDDILSWTFYFFLQICWISSLVTKFWMLTVVFLQCLFGKFTLKAS